jgi:hypothetical protein
MELSTIEDKEVEGDQLYVGAPDVDDEIRVTVIPFVMAIDVGLTFTVGEGLIVNGAYPVDVVGQPLASVAINVP